jgi:general L-amino acid transport system permease protein
MTTPTEEIRPPEPPGPLTWLRQNLFSNWYNSVLTIASLVVIFLAVRGIITWLFFTADWAAVVNFPMLYMVGQYPRDQLFRIGIILWGTCFLFGISWGVWGDVLRTITLTLAIFFGLLAIFPTDSASFTMNVRIGLIFCPLLVFLGYWIGRRGFLRGRVVLVGWLILLIATPILLSGFGGSSILPKVETSLWGGLLVTMLLAIGGILLSFPIGVALALGRRSNLPVVKVSSILFIEVVRGVPLVTILFMFSLILVLFLPSESRLDRLIRALMAVTVFSAAYTAENVRGGLAAVPPGQEEAAKAVGMSGFQIMLLIVLPQALRAVIPAIVGQFIALFKDTTLVVIIGISELLLIGRSILNSDPIYIRRQAEIYIFIAAIFWVFSYVMSSASRHLEKSLGVGER